MKQAIIRDIHDFKLARITVDTSTTFTTATAVDLPGVNQLTSNFEFDTDELRGDGVIKDIFSKVDKVTGSFSGCIDLDVLQAALGGHIVTDATVDAESDLFRLTPEASPYIYFESKTEAHGAGGGDLHIRCWKARVTNVSLEQSEQSYLTFSCDYEAIPTNYVWTDSVDSDKTGKLFWDVQIYDNATAISPENFAP